MASTARKIEPARRETPRLTLVRGGALTASRRADRIAVSSANERAYRSLFRAIVALTLLAVVVGMGPVLLGVEATRLSQRSSIIKQDIFDESNTTQQLVMQRYQLVAAGHIEQVATEQLGMVPVGGDITTVDIGSARETADAAVGAGALGETAATTAGSSWLAKLTSGDTFGAVARLASGEAQALLVGDIGLSAAR